MTQVEGEVEAKSATKVVTWLADLSKYQVPIMTADEKLRDVLLRTNYN